MNKNEPRGLRNCNPLNIRKAGTQWRGMVSNPEETDFCTFVSLAYGYRAAWIILSNYLLWFAQHGAIFCIKTIISRWAPSTENDTRAYSNRVAKLSGIPANTILRSPLLDPDSFVKIISAMTVVENGIPLSEVSVDEIKAGYKLAFGKAAKI